MILKTVGAFFGGLSVTGWLWVLLGGLATGGAIVAGAVWWHGGKVGALATSERKVGADSVQSKWDAERTATALLVVRQLDNIMADNTRLQGTKDEALRQSQARALANARAADAAGTELDRLRSEATTGTAALAADAHPACRALADRATALTAVFGECAAEYLAVAKHADGHANDAQTLTTAWPVLAPVAPLAPIPPIAFTP